MHVLHPLHLGCPQSGRRAGLRTAIALTSLVIGSLFASDATRAQGTPASPSPGYSTAQLDQMLAPIALYTDQLLSQVLIAAGYPLEVVLADRWLQNPANASLKGDTLASAIAQRPWDPSVKSLVPFPQVLYMMDLNLDWTESLGDAFIAQQAAVMDAVRRLRHRAQSTGSLVSGPEQVVASDGGNIAIAPPEPNTVYVSV